MRILISLVIFFLIYTKNTLALKCKACEITKTGEHCSFSEECSDDTEFCETLVSKVNGSYSLVFSCASNDKCGTEALTDDDLSKCNHKKPDTECYTCCDENNCNKLQSALKVLPKDIFESDDLSKKEDNDDDSEDYDDKLNDETDDDSTVDKKSEKEYSDEESDQAKTDSENDEKADNDDEKSEKSEDDKEKAKKSDSNDEKSKKSDSDDEKSENSDSDDEKSENSDSNDEKSEKSESDDEKFGKSDSDDDKLEKSEDYDDKSENSDSDDDKPEKSKSDDKKSEEEKDEDVDTEEEMEKNEDLTEKLEKAAAKVDNGTAEFDVEDAGESFNATELKDEGDTSNITVIEVKQTVIDPAVPEVIPEAPVNANKTVELPANNETIAVVPGDVNKAVPNNTVEVNDPENPENSDEVAGNNTDISPANKTEEVIGNNDNLDLAGAPVEENANVQEIDKQLNDTVIIVRDGDNFTVETTQIEIETYPNDGDNKEVFKSTKTDDGTIYEPEEQPGMTEMDTETNIIMEGENAEGDLGEKGEFMHSASCKSSVSGAFIAFTSIFILIRLF